MKRSILPLALLSLNAFAADPIPVNLTPSVVVAAVNEPITEGKFEPTWKSLEQYQTPDWFRDAKFGIWAHWGPQCQPEAGDWYARHMYLDGQWQNKFHNERYGSPSKFGFKDVIHSWKAEKWDPERLVDLYKRTGAKYFFAMANHHDNLDMWDSRHQPWNSVRVGPKKDIVGGWAKAARKQGLPFGLSVHAAHAWSWYEPAQGADKAGVAYDGKLTKADGKGTWWEGLDPQDLYAQNHKPSPDFMNAEVIHSRWNWGNGVTPPDAAYCQNFYDRTADLINQHQPDLIYFDDTALPLWPVSDAGLKVAAHFYNSNLKRSAGKSNGVIFGKILNDDQLKCMTWDIERGVPNKTLPHPWQTDTCIGGWHYDRRVYDRSQYKNAKTVIHMLADIVSKNGNLLLNVPVRGDGSIDEKEEKVLEDIAAWMKVNGEGIFATRPWKIYGEGPSTTATPPRAYGPPGPAYSAEDIRFTQKGDSLYAFVGAWPESRIAKIRSLAANSPQVAGARVTNIALLGYGGKLTWTQDAQSLSVNLPGTAPSEEAVTLKINGLPMA